MKILKLKQIADLRRRYVITRKKLTQLHWATVGILLVLPLLIATYSRASPLISGILLLVFWGTAYQLHRQIKTFREKLYPGLFIRENLLYMLYTNGLYTEYKDSRGNTKIARGAVLEYDLNEENGHVLVKALITGDEFSKKVQSLDDVLSGTLELELDEKIIRANCVEYHFHYKKPQRLILQSHSQQQVLNTLDIDLGYGVTYSPVKCPHILVSGGTGSGKSIFISYLILEFLKRKSILYVCDPKNSDLGSLSHYLGEDRVATSPNHIARIVRLTVEEMNRRYEYMRENFRYGSNFSDHGFKMTWLVFDEMGAFQASGTDKKSKEIINEVIDGIKQIILLGRQAGVFILISAQQMRAETLNTDLRDNLGLRIAFGANSSEGYRMVFGSATPDKLKSIEEKGSGYLYMQGSGKETAQYWESPYLDTNRFDFIQELQLYLPETN